MALDLETFLNGYIGTALWSSTDDEGNPLDDVFDESMVDPETKKQMLKDCSEFMRKAKNELEQADEGDISSWAGHNFWLSRNGHGSGFWDVDDYKNKEKVNLGMKLDKIAKTFGSYDLYVGDDGYIHGSGGRSQSQPRYDIASTEPRMSRKSEADSLEALATQLESLEQPATAADPNLQYMRPQDKEGTKKAMLQVQKALEQLGQHWGDVQMFLGRDADRLIEIHDWIKKNGIPKLR